MIDGIRSVRLLVPDVEQARAWYGRMLEAEPYLSEADSCRVASRRWALPSTGAWTAWRARSSGS